MPRNGFWIINAQGEQELLPYDEIDPEILPGFFKPVGGFCFRAEDFMHMPLASAPFYLEGWLPKLGRLELYAPAKAGKTYAGMQLARCIGAGEPFLGVSTNQGRVLYLQFELGEKVLQDRMISTGKDYDNVYLGTTFSMKLDHSVGQQQLLDALVAIKPNVLILDPWYKIMRGDENEAQDTEKLTDFLDEAVIEGFGCSVVIFHHAGKDVTKGGRGSSVLEGWVDSYIEMKKISKNDDPLRIRIMPKLLRHAALPPTPIEAVLDGFEFVLDEEKKVEDSIKYEIEAVARDTKGASWSVKELVSCLSTTNRGTIYKHLNALISEGKVFKVGRGEYAYRGESPQEDLTDDP